MLRLLSIKRVAEMLDVSDKTVRRWIKDGEFPAPTHTLPGGNLRWDESVVKGWLAVHSAEFARYIPNPVKGKGHGKTGDNRGQEGTSVGGASVN